jgi:TRAP-type C4-dicarboxylate transport system substrate-binding protein
MRKRLILALAMALVMVGGLLTATNSKAAAVSPKTDFDMKPQEWNCTVYMPSITAFYDVQMQKAFDRIKQRTNGLLSVKVVPSGVLPIKPTDWMRAVKAGDLQMSLLGADYHASDYPMWGLLNVPYLYSDEFNKRLVWDAARPILQREMHKDGIHILKYRPCPNQSLNLSKAADLFNLKGLKVRSYSKPISLIIETIGGTPVTMPSAEVATALERGTIQGVLTTASAILQLGWTKPLPYTYDIQLPLGIWSVAINDRLWHSLPSAVQNIVYEELDQWEAQSELYCQIVDIPGVFANMAAAGAIVKKAPPEFVKLMHEKVTKPTMAEEVAKAGAVGEEILRAVEAALGRKVR